MSVIKNLLGKKKATIGATSIVTLIVVVVTLVFSGTFSSASAAVRKGDNGYIYYSNKSDSIDIPLDTASTNEKLAFFKKQLDGTYILDSCSDITSGATKISIAGNWTAYEQNAYYMLITDKEETELQVFSGKLGTEEGDIVTLKDGENKLALQIVKVVYDNEAPNMTVQANTSEWSKSVTLTINATDNSEGCGLHKDAYSFDGGQTWQSSNTKIFTTNQTVNIQTRDALGQVTSTIDQVVNNIDVDAPTVTKVSVTPDAQTTWTKSAIIKIEGATDASSGLNAQPYSFDGGQTWQTSAEYAVSANGVYTIRVKDILENIYDYGDIDITHIDTAPVITIDEQNISTTDWAKKTISFEFSVEDIGSGYDMSEINGTIPNGVVSIAKKDNEEDTYIATVTCDDNKYIDATATISIKDKIGNESSKTTDKSIKIDCTKPVITIDENTISTELQSLQTQFDFTVTDTGSGVSIGSIKATVNNGTVSITSKSGVDNTFTATVVAESEEIVEDNITITASDVVGNETITKSIKNVRVDASSPTLKICEETVKSDWSKGSTSFEFIATDKGIGFPISKINGTVPNGKVNIAEKMGVANTYIATVTPNANSVVDAQVTITIRKFFLLTISEKTSKHVKVDATSPTITIKESTISSGWLQEPASFEFVVTDTGSGVNLSDINGSIDNGTVSISEKDITTHTYVATVRLKEGLEANNKHINAVVTIATKDLVGNESSKATSKPIKIDNVSPEIVIDEDTISVDWNKAQTKFDFIVKDIDSGISTNYKNDIKAVVKNGVISIEAKSGMQNTYTATIVADGEKVITDNITITASDKVKNQSTAISTKEVKVDASSSTITISEASINQNWTKDSTSFEFTAVDQGSGFSLSDISGVVKNGVVSVISKEGSANTYIATVTSNTNSVVDGSVTITINKQYGYPKSVETLGKIKIDSTSPIITIKENTILDKWSQKVTSFEFIVQDTGAGVRMSDISGTVNNGIVSIDKKLNSPNTYVATVTAKDNSNIDDKVTIKVVDIVNNQQSIDTTENIKADNTVPTIAINESTINNDWVKKSTSFEFVVTDTGALVPLSNISAKVVNGTINIAAKKDVQDTYIATITAADSSIINEKPAITVLDLVGNNTSKSSEKFVKVDNQEVVMTNFKTEKVTGSQDSNVVKNGDTVKVSFNLTDGQGSGISSDTVKIIFNGSEAKVAKVEKDTYSYIFTVNSDFIGTEDTLLTVTRVTFADNVDNRTTPIENDVTKIKYYAPINDKFSDLTFKSSNENSVLVRNGQKVFVSFYTTHPVLTKEDTIAQTEKGKIIWTKQNDATVDKGRYYHEGYYVVFDDSKYDNKNLKLDFTLYDLAENTEVKKTNANATDVKYFAPIEEGFSSLTFTSNNQKTPNIFAKDNDIVTVKFKTTHPVNISNTTIASQGVTFASNDGMNWTGIYTIKNGAISDNTDIEFRFELNDDAGNNAISKTQDNTAKVRYQAPISIHKLAMVSDNITTPKVIAKNGNRITVNFSTTHPVTLSSTKIAGRDVAFSSIDGMNWVATYTVTNGDTVDNDYIKLLFNTNDLAGNSQVISTENNTTTEKVKYYSPMVVSNVIITTNNIKDTNKYSKDGDIVTVKFTTNHAVTLSNTSIAGKNVNITNVPDGTIGQVWTLTCSIANGDVKDLDDVTFSFITSDIAGNDPISKTNTATDVKNTIKYYAPITATTAIASNYKNTDYVKNGDIITITNKSNHPVTVASANVLGRGTTNGGENTTDLTLAYQMGAGEANVTEGDVTFNYVLTDLSGNTLTVDKTNGGAITKVTYDRTNPTVSMLPNSISFTSNTVTYSVVFKDEHLNGADMSVLVNGQEYMTANDRASVTGKEYVKQITLDLDGNYTVKASMLDKAGNKTNPDASTSVTIDKTNPEIKAVNIDIEKPTTNKAGFVISKYFNFIDENINQVICTVTDDNGTYDWDVDEPLTTDGKKTIYLMITDMANNVSTAITYDVYIDGTEPKPVVKDAVTNTVLNSGTSSDTFISEMTLEISLEALNIGDTSEVDKFTMLKLVDKSGNEVVDILNSLTKKDDRTYSYPMKEYGEYTLLAASVDGVGNETGNLEYKFIFKDKTVLTKYYENTPLFVTSMAILAVASVAGVGSLIFKLRK